MNIPALPRRQILSALLAALCAFLPAAQAAVEVVDEQQRLQQGEVLIWFAETESSKFVVGRVLINEPPERVWPVLSNPFEFERRICSRLKAVEVLRDEKEISVMRCTVGLVFPFPDIRYVVESTYVPGVRIDYRRTGGNLKDFRGSWEMKSIAEGNGTEVTYSVFVDPGIPLPRWLIREAVKMELPRTLNGLRDRVHDLSRAGALPVIRTISAARLPGVDMAVPVAEKAR